MTSSFSQGCFLADYTKTQEFNSSILNSGNCSKKYIFGAPKTSFLCGHKTEAINKLCIVTKTVLMWTAHKMAASVYNINPLSSIAFSV